jgi:tetratricopeptide (TPR) repeat protein
MAVADLAEVAELWDRAAEYDLKLADLAKDPAERWKFQLAAAKAYTLGGRIEKALVIYKAAIAASTGDQLEDAARGAGLAYENARRWKDAVGIYDAYLASPAASTVDPWALARKAVCQQKAGDTSASSKTWIELVTRFPKHQLAADGLLELGARAEDRKDFEAAKADYTRVIDGFPGTPREGDARARLATATARAIEWEKVRLELSRMADKYPKRERKGD